MIDTLVVGAVAVLICLGALHLLDRRLDRLDRLRRQQEAALQRAALIQRLSHRRAADVTEPGEDGDLGGAPQWPNKAA
jgi:hypothetical protein